VLLPERVTERSNIPNRVPEDMEGGPFGMLTAQIDETATKKQRQFRYTTKPGILAIASSHFASHILLDSQWALAAVLGGGGRRLVYGLEVFTHPSGGRRRDRRKEH